jgi:hypothetical protein
MFDASETGTFHWFVTVEDQPSLRVRKRRGIVLKHGKLNNRGIRRGFSRFHRGETTVLACDWEMGGWGRSDVFGAQPAVLIFGNGTNARCGIEDSATGTPYSPNLKN